MAKKLDNTIPVVSAPQTSQVPNQPKNMQVEFVVVDGKIVPDNHPGVIQ